MSQRLKYPNQASKKIALGELGIRKLQLMGCVFGMLWHTVACQDINFTDQYLKVKIIGDFEEPSYLASHACNDNWFEPVTQNLTLIDMRMEISDPDTGEVKTIDIYDDPPLSFRISNRIQKIFEKKISVSELSEDLVGKTIHSFRIVFEDEITGSSKLSSSLQTSLGEASSADDPCEGTTLKKCDEADGAGECTVISKEGFSVSTGQSYSYIIKVQWKRTVERDTDAVPNVDKRMLSPGFHMSVLKE